MLLVPNAKLNHPFTVILFFTGEVGEGVQRPQTCLKMPKDILGLEVHWNSKSLFIAGDVKGEK